MADLLRSFFGEQKPAIPLSQHDDGTPQTLRSMAQLLTP